MKAFFAQPFHQGHLAQQLRAVDSNAPLNSLFFKRV
jgi:hypothetical protein